MALARPPRLYTNPVPSTDTIQLPSPQLALGHLSTLHVDRPADPLHVKVKDWAAFNNCLETVKIAISY